jgi:stage V sporulation protein R
MSEWTISELEEWDEKICEIAKAKGLDWFPIAYETCDYHEMIGHMSYHGMPSHYGHWSFGKSFERTHHMYNSGNEGLPYELIINSNPSIAYLMKENPLYLQVLIMAHCVGHSDFFKNNRTFRNTDPDRIIQTMRNAKKRFQSYIEDPSIGIEKVEKVIDACHAIQYQVDRNDRFKRNHKELRQEILDLKKLNPLKYVSLDPDKMPLEPDYDILDFLANNSKNLEPWEVDIISVIQEESKYFWPQIKTKIMNEGWASFWHYRILHELNLSDGMHIPFLKTHNLVIRPWMGRINPYHLGFEIFKNIEKKFGIEECFIARETCNDSTFIWQYLDNELMNELNMFTYSPDKGKNPDWLIRDISDEQGYQEIKKTLMKTVSGNSIPVIYVDQVDKDTLILKHEHDDRDLELDYAENCVMKIKDLWKNPVKLFTIIEDEEFEIS